MIARATVLVSGAPGSGKTTLARSLAVALGFALLSKDDIKETLHDALPSAGQDDLAWSRRLGAASMEVLWTLARHCPQVVLESAFRPRGAHELRRLPELSGPIVEVHCACPPDVCARRYAERNVDAHPTHVIKALTPELLAEFDGPVGVGHLITVDTTQPVDIPSLATTVRASLACPEVA